MAERAKVVIIGSGPAGYTAAIYAARAGLEPLMIDGSMTGGQLMLTTMVENFPGFADGVMGPDLMEAMRKQAARVGTRFLQDFVQSVDLSRRPFVLKTLSEEILADTLIIATGAGARKLGLPSEARLTGHGISYCASCDGFFFREKDVFVVGAGDSALEDAHVLSRLAKSVTVVNRATTFKASKSMVDRVKDKPNVSFLSDSAVEEILDGGTGEVTGVRIKNLVTGKLSELRADGVFIAIGHTPNTDLFKNQLELTESGQIKCDGVKTSVSGVFAAGDVMDDRYMQAVVAAGNGAAAALEARWLLEEAQVVERDEPEKVAAGHLDSEQALASGAE